MTSAPNFTGTERNNGRHGRTRATIPSWHPTSTDRPIPANDSTAAHTTTTNDGHAAAAAATGWAGPAPSETAVPAALLVSAVPAAARARQPYASRISRESKN